MTAEREPFPFLRWAQRHRTLVRLLPMRISVWFAWREVRRSPKVMAELARWSEARKREQR